LHFRKQNSVQSVFFLWYNAVPVEDAGIHPAKNQEQGNIFGIIARKDRVRWLNVQTAARQPLSGIIAHSLNAPPIGIGSPTCKK
jgi:hypothetical protein